MYVNTDAVAVFLNKMNIVYLINLFTIINMLLNHTSYAEFFNDNNFIMKFIITDSHNLLSTSICITSSYCLFFWILFSWHNSHLMMYFMIWFLKSLILHLHHTKFSILLTSRCLSVWLLWHSYISSLSIRKVFSTLYVVTNFFVRILFFLNRISV